MTGPKVRILFRILDGRPDLPLPSYSTAGAAGLDLPAAESADIPPSAWVTVRTGLEVELPPGHEGQVRPRSGLASRHGVTVLNAPGTIDEDYRGELAVVLMNHGREPYRVNVGDRIAQLVVAPVSRVDVEGATELGASARGRQGFGHTGA